MLNQTVLSKVARALDTQHRTNSRLLDATAALADRIKHQIEIGRRRNLRQRLLAHRRTAIRVRIALQGLNALCAVGQSRQLQALIEARGMPITLWGDKHVTTPGYDMKDIYWMWVSSIMLTKTEIQLKNYTATSGDTGQTYTIERDEGSYFDFHFPYANADDFLRTRLLWRIATEYALDWEELGHSKDINDQYSTDTLFEVFVDCADSKKFGKLLGAAIGL